MPIRTLIIALVISLFTVAPAWAQQNATVIFAAASLKNVIDDLAAVFFRNTGFRLAVSFAASSSLAKQIEQGAPADIFISADVEWMDYLAGQKLIQPKSRINLAGNRLVLIAPKTSKLGNVTIEPGFDLAGLAGGGRIAVADTRAVPAGRYAKTALERLGAWSTAGQKLAPAENVRAALALVARGEAPLGIVYETDVKVEPDVKIVGRFPENSHRPIVYPAALTANAKPDSAKFFTFLGSGTALVLFERHGFTYLAKAGP